MPFPRANHPRRAATRSLPPTKLRQLEAQMTTPAGYRAYAAWTMLEETLQHHCLQLAGLLGWELTYHTLDSRGSGKGFPDLVLVHPEKKRVLWLELKAEGERAKPEQVRWAEALTACGQEHHFVWPSDYHEGRLEEWLK